MSSLTSKDVVQIQPGLFESALRVEIVAGKTEEVEAACKRLAEYILDADIDNASVTVHRARVEHDETTGGGVLSKIDELLQVMICSAEVFTDAEGTVTGYKIKPGALHKIVGVRTHLFFPQNMKEATPEKTGCSGDQS